MVTLYQVFPTPARTEAETDARSPERVTLGAFESRLRAHCEEAGTEFVDYQRASGQWTFRVPVFLQD